jgi:hypothetical protein
VSGACRFPGAEVSKLPPSRRSVRSIATGVLVSVGLAAMVAACSAPDRPAELDVSPPVAIHPEAPVERGATDAPLRRESGTPAATAPAGPPLVRESGARREDLPTQDTGGRPFLHLEHDRLVCTECHGTGPLHPSISVRTTRDCAACHHDSRRIDTCGECHERPDPPGPRQVTATLSLTVWDTARTRALPFAHDTHGEVACRDCHRMPVTLVADVDCARCHDSHHRPEAICSQCHSQAEPAAHPLEAHAGCAGSGCHTSEVIAKKPVLSPNLCLVCHAEQVDHEQGKDCASCHIPGLARHQIAAASAPTRDVQLNGEEY